MPAELQEKNPQEKIPGVYVRAENELPHELDMLWSPSRNYQREERSPIVPFIAGLLVGAILTAAVFMLFLSHPQIKANENEMVAPLSDDVGSDQPATTTGQPAVPAASGSNAIEKATAGSTTYTVRSGDTLGGIAAKVYGSSAPSYVDKIQRANNMSSPDALQLDQKLVIPPKDY